MATRTSVVDIAAAILIADLLGSVLTDPKNDLHTRRGRLTQPWQAAMTCARCIHFPTLNGVTSIMLCCISAVGHRRFGDNSSAVHLAAEPIPGGVDSDGADNSGGPCCTTSLGVGGRSRVRCGQRARALARCPGPEL